MEDLFIIEGDGRKRPAVEVTCQQCGKKFLTRKQWENTRKYCSRECSYLGRQIRVSVTCAYCGIEFERAPSKLKNSKSGLYFCCREHKDIGQKIENGIIEIQPPHYGTESTNYRKTAFENYPNECECCKNNDIDLLQVHHIDEDRRNNDLLNLIILCANCHFLLTQHKAILKDRELIRL